jgi:hypothetical protein
MEMVFAKSQDKLNESDGKSKDKMKLDLKKIKMLRVNMASAKVQ